MFYFHSENISEKTEPFCRAARNPSFSVELETVDSGLADGIPTTSSVRCGLSGQQPWSSAKGSGLWIDTFISAGSEFEVKMFLICCLSLKEVDGGTID